ncbi:hypothetical protein JXA05_03610 [Candidatus Peregrinibacteria bacterium]|nr:hypothetical protein [Candidatus Peregrinibacteria bacterium]
MPKRIFPILKKAIRLAFPVILFSLGLFVMLKAAYAASYLGGDWDQFIKSQIPSFTQPGTGEDLATAFIRNGIRIVRNIVGAIALIMGILYGMSLIFARGKEETITKQKNNFLYMMIGFVVLIVAENVAGIFNPEKAAGDKLIDFQAASDQLRDIMNYVKWLLGSVTVLLMTISGIRMITAGSDEETVTKQKRNLTWSLIGLLVILLASNIVNAVYVMNEKGEAVGAAAPQTAIQEIAGVVRLLLVFLGPIAVLFTIYAGYIYLTALDNEERSKKGKMMIVGGVTGIVMVYAAYAIVNTLLSSQQLGALPFFPLIA